MLGAATVLLVAGGVTLAVAALDDGDAPSVADGERSGDAPPADGEDLGPPAGEDDLSDATDEDGTADEDGTTDEGDADGDRSTTDGPSTDGGPDPRPVDPAGLAGADAAFAQLLNHVDAAERAMIAFQERLRDELADDTDRDALFAAISGSAVQAQADLARHREDLTAAVDHEGATAVRDRYVEHLDAWVRYLEAVEQDPSVLVGRPEDRAFTDDIDTTGYAFADALREQLPAVAALEVVGLAEAILERGFSQRELADADTVELRRPGAAARHELR